MSGIEIHSLEGGNKIKVPEDKTSVGRGPLLQVTDKKVSRNHATIEINDKGEMVLIPIHTNPCFYKAGGKGDKTILPKDKPKILNHLDVFGLLPDKLYFKVVYLDQLKADKKPKKEVKEEEKSETDATDEAENEDATPTKKKSPKYKDMALPLEKTRKLPKWMVGASKRVSVGQKKETPAKAAKPRVAANARVTPKRAPPPKRSRRHVSDDDDEDYEEEVTKPVRRPRAASQKKTSYKDEFVASGDDLDISASSEDDVPKTKNDEDSDFSMDEIDNDSGSDWGAQQKKSKSTPTRRGRARGRRSRGSASKRRMGSDSEDFLDDDDDDYEDNYVPRPSKRRAPPKKKKPETESEESEESEEEVKPKKTSRRRRRKDSDSEEERRPKRKAKRKISDDEDDDDDDDDNEEEDDVPKKKRRRLCQFGKKCYRKNPGHFKDYCHPGDTSYDEALEAAEEEAMRPTRKTALREKDKKSVLRHASDDDGEANTYDYKDSFLDDKDLPEGDSSSSASDPNEGDSDYDPEAEEDLAALKHEAKGFLRNKKLQKPTRSK